MKKAGLLPALLIAAGSLYAAGFEGSIDFRITNGSSTKKQRGTCMVILYASTVSTTAALL
jgi:hypothetical protein